MADYCEADRLLALADYNILDTAPELAFDRLTALAADLFDAPIALVSLIDADRQWFKSRRGLAAESTPRSLAFCAHAIERGPHTAMVVEDATVDPRFSSNPLVTGAPHVAFYAGAVLTDKNGFNLGTLCVIDTKARPAPSEQDLRRLKALAQIVVDELELRRTTREAQERGRLLEMAERISGVGHWRYQFSDGRISWSDEVYRIHGLSPDAYDPQLGDALEFYPEAERVMIAGLLERAAATGEGYQFEVRLRQAGGDLRHVVCKAETTLAADGKVEALVGVFQDVTAHKEALERLARGQARYKLLADNAADVIARIRLNGGSSYISPSIHALLGYRPEEMAGRSAQDFVPAADRPLIMAAFAKLSAGEPEVTVEHHADHKDGRSIWVESRFRLVRDGEDAPVEMVGVIRDITARKILEAELRSARAAAEDAAAVKADFIANVSHEIRTPLTAILGFTGLLAHRKDLDASAQSHLKRVAGAGEALLAIVNDILDFSKLEAGQVEIAPRPVAPAALLHEAVLMFTPQAEAKGLDLSFSADNLPPTLSLDPDRVRQIVLNLVGNAVKFTASGEVRVSAAYDRVSQQLQVQVQDSGAGMSEEQQNKLFQRFSQVDGSTTRRHGGTGLGLAICKGLTEAMGGAIGVTSQPDKGSTFSFTLWAPGAAAPGEEPLAAEAGAMLDGLRVLVIDDNAMNNELARVVLQQMGAEVIDAADGASGLEAAAVYPVDVILLDMRMPDMTGHEVLARIRALAGPNQDVPVLAFTADAESRPPDNDGFDGVVHKPISAAGLAAAIDAAVRNDPPAARESGSSL